MKTPLSLSLSLLLPLALHAQVLNLGASVNLYQAGSPIWSGSSVAWARDPIKDIAWIQLSDPTEFAYVVRDTTGLVVTPLDDHVMPFGTGTAWQEGSDLPEQVWLRVYLTDDLLLPGDPVGDWAVRSVRFGFSRPGVEPFELPEPRQIALLAGIGLVGFAAYRRFWS